jgi:hypothetical protein
LAMTFAARAERAGPQLPVARLRSSGHAGGSPMEVFDVALLLCFLGFCRALRIL